MMPLPLIIALGLVLIYLITQGIRATHENKTKTSTPVSEKKPEDKKEEKKGGYSVGWVIGIAIAVSLLTWWLTSSQEQEKTAEAMARAELAVVKKIPEYEWYWKLPRNVYLRGKNEKAPDERKAEVVFRPDGSIRADISYFEDGSPEAERLRLTKVGSKTWEGTWEQDNPADSAHVTVEEVAPDVYAGDITFKGGLSGRCHLKRIR